MIEFCIGRSLFGYPIEARVHRLDFGAELLITGGSRTHVGAVSYAFPGEKNGAVEFPGHKDQLISDRFAEELCRVIREPVVCCSGIHYDKATPEDIQKIVETSELILSEIIQKLSDDC